MASKLAVSDWRLVLDSWRLVLLVSIFAFGKKPLDHRGGAYSTTVRRLLIHRMALTWLLWGLLDCLGRALDWSSQKREVGCLNILLFLLGRLFY